VTSVDLMGKPWEEWNGVLDAGEGWVKVEFSAECAPLVPVGAVDRGAAGMDSSCNRILAKAVSPACAAALMSDGALSKMCPVEIRQKKSKAVSQAGPNSGMQRR
jgi:hypothetical protein